MNAKIVIVALLLVVANTTYAEDYAPYASVARDSNGQVMDGAIVTVYVGGTTTLAQLYSNGGGTPYGNPFLTNSVGEYQFFAVPGMYDLSITKSGVGSAFRSSIPIGTQTHAERHEDGGPDVLSIENMSGEHPNPQKIEVWMNGVAVSSNSSINFENTSSIIPNVVDNGTDIAIEFTLGSDSVGGTNLQDGSVTSNTVVDGSLSDVDIDPIANIQESKLGLLFPTHPNSNDPTTNQKAALAGTFGSPSASNRYITEQDPSINVISPHASTHGVAGNDPVTISSSQISDLPDLEEELHGGEHEDGGDDEISVQGLLGTLNDPQPTSVYEDGVLVSTHPSIEFKEGGNTVLTVTDDNINNRSVIQIDSLLGLSTLTEMVDVDTSGVSVGKALLWNGVDTWIPSTSEVCLSDGTNCQLDVTTLDIGGDTIQESTSISEIRTINDEGGIASESSPDVLTFDFLSVEEETHGPEHEAGGSDTINHDLLVGYEASEHVDWSSIGAGTIDTSNYVDNDNQNASEVTILDVGTYYIGTTIEDALQEVASGITLDSRYLNFDEIAGGDVSGTFSSLVVGDDTHQHAGTTISGLDASDTTTGTFSVSLLPTATTISSGIVELATSGENLANKVVQGNDSRLSDSRIPTPHASTHVQGQSDALSGTLNVSITGTSTSFATNPTNCSVGYYTRGVDSSGGAESCTLDDDIPEAGDFGNATDLDSNGNVTNDSHLHTLSTVTVPSTRCVTIENPTNTDNFLFFRSDNLYTVTRIDCISQGGTSAVMTLQECNTNGGSCVTIESATCTTSNVSDTTISNNVFDNGDWMRIDIGTVTGAVTQASLCVVYQN